MQAVPPQRVTELGTGQRGRACLRLIGTSGLREAGGSGPTGCESAGLGGRQGLARCHRAVPSRVEGRRDHALLVSRIRAAGTWRRHRETDESVCDLTGCFALQEDGYTYGTAAKLPPPLPYLLFARGSCARGAVPGSGARLSALPKLQRGFIPAICKTELL